MSALIPWLGRTVPTYTAPVTSRPPIEIDIVRPGSPEPQTVTPEGERIAEFIDGVQLRPAITHSDERGSLTEVYDPAWDVTDDPLVYVYESRIHPGQKKGWIVHFEQDDRLFFSVGSAKVVMYDARTASPTRGLRPNRAPPGWVRRTARRAGRPSPGPTRPDGGR